MAVYLNSNELPAQDLSSHRFAWVNSFFLHKKQNSGTLSDYLQDDTY